MRVSVCVRVCACACVCACVYMHACVCVLNLFLFICYQMDNSLENLYNVNMLIVSVFYSIPVWLTLGCVSGPEYFLKQICLQEIYINLCIFNLKLPHLRVETCTPDQSFFFWSLLKISHKRFNG